MGTLKGSPYPPATGYGRQSLPSPTRLKRRSLLAGMAGGAGAALLAGCGSRQPKPVDFSEVTRVYRPLDYEDVYERWTRHNKLVRDIGTVLEVWATYKSWDFRQAYVEAYGEAYGLGEADRRNLRQAQLEASRQLYEFHVIAQCTDWKWNDLHQQDSVWKTRLVDGAGRELLPAALKAEKLPDLYEMRFFPARTDFSRTYTISFPRQGQEADRRFTGAGSGRLILRVSGPLGRVESTWSSV